MIKEVADAIDRQDYQTAQQILTELRISETENLWVQFYGARLQELGGKLDLAMREYRELLQLTTNLKLIAQIRQGIGRLEALEKTEIQHQKEQRQSALDRVKANPSNQEIGLLILEPIPNEEKQALAKEFARIMQIDPYTARLQLPSRSWRLYRVGVLGELQVYVNDFKEVGIPCFCRSIKEINRPNVYLTRSFETVIPNATIIYKAVPDRWETLSFDWSEVTAKVAGLVPIFGECVDMDAQRKQVRKISILDYVQIIDLHLEKRNAIIRLCDSHYNFQKGIAFSEKQQQGHEGQTTNRDNWNHLARYLKQQLPEVPVWPDFKPFAETTADFYELLRAVEPHLDLLRIEDSYWDTAFQLYSSLIFLEKSPNA